MIVFVTLIFLDTRRRSLGIGPQQSGYIYYNVVEYICDWWVGRLAMIPWPFYRGIRSIMDQVPIDRNHSNKIRQFDDNLFHIFSNAKNVIELCSNIRRNYWQSGTM